MVYYLFISLNLTSFFFSLLLRFTDDTFDNEQAATIGVDFKVKLIRIRVSYIKCSNSAFCILSDEFNVIVALKDEKVAFEEKN